jgi:hypothetical protein
VDATQAPAIIAIVAGTTHPTLILLDHHNTMQTRRLTCTIFVRSTMVCSSSLLIMQPERSMKSPSVTLYLIESHQEEDDSSFDHLLDQTIDHDSQINT